MFSIGQLLNYEIMKEIILNSEPKVLFIPTESELFVCTCVFEGRGLWEEGSRHVGLVDWCRASPALPGHDARQWRRSRTTTCWSSGHWQFLLL